MYRVPEGPVAGRQDFVARCREFLGFSAVIERALLVDPEIGLSQEQAEEILGEVDGILEKTVKAGKAGTSEILLKEKAGLKQGKSAETDIRERLFYAFADHRTPILRMETRRASLEDVFLELTQGEKGDETK